MVILSACACKGDKVQLVNGKLLEQLLSSGWQNTQQALPKEEVNIQ